MLSFDEWLAYQQVDPTRLTTEELAAWHSAYEEASASAAQVTRWTPRVRSSLADDLYAVAVRDAADLWLFAWVRRSQKKNEFFMMIPRPDRSIDAHASLHENGLFHLRGFGFTHLDRRLQKPDANFKGAVQLTTTPIALHTAREVMAVCDPAYFNGVFELRPSDIAGSCTVAVDLVERDGVGIRQPWSRMVKRRRYTGHIPEVLITIWESQYQEGVSDQSNAWT